MDKGAIFSTCRTWRYQLWRIWDKSKPYAMFLMLNPSTADEENNDPTVARCQDYAQTWGYGGLYVCNIFAYRATDRAVMKVAPDPIGPDNDRSIIQIAKNAGIVVCGWGNDGSFMNRSQYVCNLLNMLSISTHCLVLTNSGEPHHPLYLKKTLKPFLFKYQEQ